MDRESYKNEYLCYIIYHCTGSEALVFPNQIVLLVSYDLFHINM